MHPPVLVTVDPVVGHIADHQLISLLHEKRTAVITHRHIVIVVMFEGYHAPLIVQQARD